MVKFTHLFNSELFMPSQTAQLDVQDVQKQFFIAAAQGDLSTVKQLYENQKTAFDLNAIDPGTNESALFKAAHNGQVKVVKYLLKIKSIDLTLMCHSVSALHIAAYQGHINVVAAILATPEGKFNINIKSEGAEFRPLHLASQKGHAAIVKLLLNAGADRNAKSKVGFTALDSARKNEIVLLLDGCERRIHQCIIQHMRMLGFQSNLEGVCFGFAEVAKIYALSGKKSLSYFYEMVFLLKRLSAKDILSMKNFHDQLIQEAENQALNELHVNKVTVLEEKQYKQFHTRTLEILAVRRKNLTKEQQDNEKNYLNILSLFNAFELEFQGEGYLHLADPGFNSVRMSKAPTPEQFNTDDIVLSNDKERLTAYWYVNNKPHKKTILIDASSEIISALPEEKSSMHPDLIRKVVATFGFFPHNKFVNQKQNPGWVTPLIQPIELEVKGGEAEVAHFTGAYQKADLSMYFSSFRDQIRQNKEIDEPIVFCLEDSIHAISVMYNPMHDTWEIFDANQMPSKPEELKDYIMSGEMDISEKVIQCFSSNGNAIFQTRMCTTQKSFHQVKPAIDKWREDTAPLHRVTPEKAILVDSNSSSWLYVAAKIGEEGTVKSLLRNGAYVHRKKSDSKVAILTPLYVAAQNGHETTVALLLEQEGIQPNTIVKGKSNALMIAASNGQTVVVKTLLEQKVDPNVGVNVGDGSTALLLAAQYGHSDSVELLLKTRAINFAATLATGESLLFKAAQNGHLNVIQTLLVEKSEELDPNIQNTQGATALHMAAMHGHTAIVHTLLQAKFKAAIKLNLPLVKCGATPIDMAAKMGHDEIVRMLIKAGANVDTIFRGQYSSAWIAALNNHGKVITALAEAKANFNVPDKEYGHTPVHVAAVQGNFRAMNALITAQAGLDISDFKGRTPIFLAAKKGHAPIIEVLAAADANPNKANEEGMTPIIIAVTKKRIHAVRALVRHGGDLRIPDNLGKTALHYAFEIANSNFTSPELFKQEAIYPLIQLLLNAGADISIKDSSDKTPLDYLNDSIKLFMKSEFPEKMNTDSEVASVSSSAVNSPITRIPDATFFSNSPKRKNTIMDGVISCCSLM